MVGLILITIYSAYYSFGTMLFGVYTVAAVKGFWNTEFLMGTKFAALCRHYRDTSLLCVHDIHKFLRSDVVNQEFVFVEALKSCNLRGQL